MTAVTGGKPKEISIGKVTRVPEPTTALMEPAAKPASKMAMTSTAVMAKPVPWVRGNQASIGVPTS
jgi:hypothetical protein